MTYDEIWQKIFDNKMVKLNTVDTSFGVRYNFSIGSTEFYMAEVNGQVVSPTFFRGGLRLPVDQDIIDQIHKSCREQALPILSRQHASLEAATNAAYKEFMEKIK